MVYITMYNMLQDNDNFILIFCALIYLRNIVTVKCSLILLNSNFSYTINIVLIGQYTSLS